MAAAHRIVEAVVLTGATETPYRRAGQGRPVLLLVDAPALLETLAAERTVVQPLRLPAADDPGWHRWLQGLVDGLGLGRSAVVAPPGLAGQICRLATLDPDRIGPVLDAAAPSQLLARLRALHEIIDG